MVRFGSACNDTWSRVAEMAWGITRFLFIGPVPQGLLESCHFEWERGPYDLPMLGWWVGVGLVALALYHLRRRRFLELLPFSVILLILITYLYGGAAFRYRYAGDFWPIVFLILCRFWMRVPRLKDPKTAILPLAFLSAVSAQVTWRAIARTPSVIVQSAEQTRAELEDFYADLHDPRTFRLPVRRECGNALAGWLHTDRMGWGEDCSVGPYTNLFLGVPLRPGGNIRVSLFTDRALAPSLRVFINGRIYTGKWKGDHYETDFELPGRIVSPNVVVTVEWVKGDEPPRARLLGVEAS
jgi:hypothetical protein